MSFRFLAMLDFKLSTYQSQNLCVHGPSSVTKRSLYAECIDNAAM